uniref:Putative secreted protein n=1 Tax=Anopheles marajoara TaxID=58244 RepID=A0A2M4C9D3_9DIPT
MRCSRSRSMAKQLVFIAELLRTVMASRICHLHHATPHCGSSVCPPSCFLLAECSNLFSTSILLLYSPPSIESISSANEIESSRIRFGNRSTRHTRTPRI